MNLLDLIILLIALGYLLDRALLSAAYHSTLIVLSLVGYCLALVMAALVSNAYLDESMHKGIATIVIIATTLGLTTLIGHKIGMRLRLRAITGELYAADRALSYPVKVAGVAALLFVVTQTFMYIPLTQLQFMAQGSTLFITADKFMPDTIYRTTAQQIDPEQFSSLVLETNRLPITTDRLEPSEQFGSLAFGASESVVKVTGSMYAGLSGGSGSGFSVGDGLYATAAHVVIELSSVYIKPVGGGAYPATPLIIDQNLDVAILRSDYLSLPPLELFDGRTAAQTPALALGFPGNGNLTASEGDITIPEKAPLNSESSPLDNTNTYLYDNPRVKPGSSGSAVMNTDGDVIGIAVAISQLREYRSTLGYKVVSSNGAIVVDSNVIADALARAEHTFRSQGTGLGRTFAGY